MESVRNILIRILIYRHFPIIPLFLSLFPVLFSWLGDRIKKALSLRRSKTDEFRSQNGYGWDYVLVFKVYDEDEVSTSMQRKFSMKLILGQLGQANLETRLHYSLLVSVCAFTYLNEKIYIYFNTIYI